MVHRHGLGTLPGDVGHGAKTFQLVASLAAPRDASPHSGSLSDDGLGLRVLCCTGLCIFPVQPSMDPFQLISAQFRPSSTHFSPVQPTSGPALGGRWAVVLTLLPLSISHGIHPLPALIFHGFHQIDFFQCHFMAGGL